MLVKNWMSKSPVTIEPDASLDQAEELFRTRVISMLPVTDGDALVGVVTDGDIKKALPSKATLLDRYELRDLMGKVKINTIMSAPAQCIDWDATVDQAARLMLNAGISGLPVIEGRFLTGVITKSDIFRCLVAFAGGSQTGQVFGFNLEEQPGKVKKITEVIAGFNGRLSCIMTSYADIEAGLRKVFFYVRDVDSDVFETLVTRLHAEGELTYIADLSRGIKRIC